ncbi:MAG: hypothetical protein C4583_08210 [Anaerolineaceae bacterium]|nr:MAG: hypothetical protein C4583_08210 [Anaerolineaceae bacterium]
MFIINLLLGASLIFWGRKLFWLFIAAAGFFTGWQLAQIVTHNELVGIIVGIVFAIIGALLAVFLKTIAIGVAGFLMGGSVLLSLAGMIGLDQGMIAWVVYIIGGIGGAILISMFFDWVVVVLSSLGGAALVVGALSLDGPIHALVFIGLFILGIVVQAGEMRKNEKHK